MTLSIFKIFNLYIWLGKDEKEEGDDGLVGRILLVVSPIFIIAACSCYCLFINCYYNKSSKNKW